MPPTPKTCSRPGCNKPLRANNTKGVCATGCRSPEATSGRAASSPRADDDVLVRFKRVAKALGKDPNAILEDATRKVAAQWLKTLEDAVQ